ncbi:hypothetical protein [Streptomyces sp. NPDC057418]|uniref:hypothetical protein n=1 Tax=Streptomyces sp. NPDC057418 TaxID=3346126 RepID=UPI0036CC5623
MNDREAASDDGTERVGHRSTGRQRPQRAVRQRRFPQCPLTDHAIDEAPSSA